MAAGLEAAYVDCQQTAEQLAGGLLEIPRRAALLQDLFHQSGGNHIFPLIAAHGALWAYGFFEVGGTLGRLIAQRYFYNRREKEYRLSLLERFATDFRTINRQVFIDTHTNFHFSRVHGREPGAEQLMPAELLQALNHVHSVVEQSGRLNDDEKAAVFRQSFQWEQERTVAGGVKQAVNQFDCPFMKALCLKPPVRFKFFPRWKYLWFRDFTSQTERVAKGLRVLELAQKAGWQRVEQSLREYGHPLPTLASAELVTQS